MNEPIKDKTPKPPGLLPKNVQSWVIVGIAVLMILIMWLTGGKKPQSAAKAALPNVLATPPAEVNENKIAELQNRIQELQRQQLAAESALSQQTRLLGSSPPQEQGVAQGAPPSNQSGETPEDAIKAERRKREYLSLFASNIALSYRKLPANTANSSLSGDAHDTPAQSPQGPEAAELVQLLKPAPSVNPAQLASAHGTDMQSAAVQKDRPIAETKHEGKENTAASRDSLNEAEGKNYILFEGTVLETVLINRLEGQFSGPVECLLSTDLYSRDRQHLLIPAGAKLLGETRKVDAFGQTRLAVVFHRLIMPDGFSLNLDQFKGLDQIGSTGLKDQVNNHYLRIFGTSLAIGALGAVAGAGSGGGLTNSNGDLMRQGFAASTAQSAAQILDRFLNILPTVTIREGHRVKVYLSNDLALPDYQNHKMPSDL
jgi:type IV secretory pathway VirB10-like protein